jgi:hypothetical protein
LYHDSLNIAQRCQIAPDCTICPLKTQFGPYSPGKRALVSKVCVYSIIDSATRDKNPILAENLLVPRCRTVRKWQDKPQVSN